MKLKKCNLQDAFLLCLSEGRRWNAPRTKILEKRLDSSVTTSNDYFICLDFSHLFCISLTYFMLRCYFKDVLALSYLTFKTSDFVAGILSDCFTIFVWLFWYSLWTFGFFCHSLSSWVPTSSSGLACLMARSLVLSPLLLLDSSSRTSS